MIIKFYIARTKPTPRVRVNANQKVRVIKRDVGIPVVNGNERPTLMLVNKGR